MTEGRNLWAEKLLREHFEWERLWFEFKFKNPGFPYITPNGVRLRLIPEGDKIRLAILVDESTNQADITSPETWKVIKEWRERLAEFQGPFFIPDIIFAMMTLREKGYSYREIAETINDDLAKAINGLMTLPKENEQDLRALDQAFIIQHLRYFRFKDEEIIEFINDGLARIAEGRPAFNPDMPISETKVKSVLQYQNDKYLKHD